MKKRLSLIALLQTCVLVLSIATSSQAKSNIVRITIGDMYFKPDTIQLKVGQDVEIKLVNQGKLEHEFMVGRAVKMEEDEYETHEEIPEAVNVKHEHHEGLHEANAGMSRGFETDFFEGIEVVIRTENGAEFMNVPGHGTMVKLKPEGKAILSFKVPTDHKGEWEMACFVDGHYEAGMKGLITIN